MKLYSRLARAQKPPKVQSYPKTFVHYCSLLEPYWGKICPRSSLYSQTLRPNFPYSSTPSINNPREMDSGLLKEADC